MTLYLISVIAIFVPKLIFYNFGLTYSNFNFYPRISKVSLFQTWVEKVSCFYKSRHVSSFLSNSNTSRIFLTCMFEFDHTMFELAMWSWFLLSIQIVWASSALNSFTALWTILCFLHVLLLNLFLCLRYLWSPGRYQCGRMTCSILWGTFMSYMGHQVVSAACSSLLPLHVAPFWESGMSLVCF